MIAKLIKLWIETNDPKEGYLLDGFPRTIAQAQLMKDNGIEIDAVVEINIPDSEIMGRLLARKREDDTEAIIGNRIKVYHSKTKPLSEFFQSEASQYIRIDGLGSIEEIKNYIIHKLRNT